MMLPFGVNSLIEWFTGDSPERNPVKRILYISHNNDKVITFDVNDRLAFPQIMNTEALLGDLKNQEASILTEDRFLRMDIPDVKTKLKHFENRDNAWGKIKDIVSDEPDIYDPSLLSVMVEEAAVKHNTQIKYIYKYLRRYWRGGKNKNALFPTYSHCGSKGKDRLTHGGKKRGRKSVVELMTGNTGVTVDENMLSKIMAGYSMFYENRKRYSLRKSYNETIAHFFSIGKNMVRGHEVLVLPDRSKYFTYETYLYWIRKKRNFKKKIISREGEKEFNLNNRPVLGRSERENFGPGSVFQIDATLADVYLVSSYDRTKIIGRPVLYVVIDVFSRAVVGFYVGLEGPSWVGAQMALLNTFENKVDVCQRFDVDITEQMYPCCHLPEKLIADRGELISDPSGALSENFNIDVVNTPPYRADWKGIVEQQFRLLNLNAISWLPGAINKRHRQRGEPNHALDGSLDINEFTKIIINTILKYNNNHYLQGYDRDEFMIAKHVTPIPNQLWQWGVQHRSGHLRQWGADFVKLNLMPQKYATVTEKGIRFKGMHYSCPTAITEQWFIKARKRSWRIDISFDFRNVNAIYWREKGTSRFERCEILEREYRYMNHRFEDTQELIAQELITTKLQAAAELQADVELSSMNNDISKEATEQTKEELQTVDLSDRQRLMGIKGNRAHDREKRREEEKFDVGGTFDSQDFWDAPEPDLNLPELPSSKSKSRLEMLKQLKRG
ncbi:Mu transposase C-terminal domain-containing protein [Paenibacillus odorifer]|uniref:Mu transposase C-terminal domain-containing protein n=1 Tax=Paenibacillus odorifer TaxID=189426 RepID=UPI0009D77BA1|nr:Mu transposase C-terminal domain-containing protein [Paenibacillus odorifer]